MFAVRYFSVRRLLSQLTEPRPASFYIARSFGHLTKPIVSPSTFVLTPTSKLHLISSANVHSLPEPPLPPIEEQFINSFGETSLASLGLCSYWPSGWYQWALEGIHVSFEVPWWGAIATTSLVMRLILFPFLLKQRRFIALYSQKLPKMIELQDKMTAARLTGDYFEIVRLSKEMNDLSTQKVNVFDHFILVFIQIPFFLSVYAGLRGMTDLPVESLYTGGLMWFTDLTIPDPYYILPALSMCSMFMIMETGPEFAASSTKVRYFCRALPFVGFLFVMNMPSALLLHWTTSNFIAMLQSFILRIPAVRQSLNLPSLTPLPKNVKKRSFSKGLKETFSNTKLLAEIVTRERFDMKTFQESGRRSAPMTFSRNPLEGPPVRTTATIVKQQGEK